MDSANSQRSGSSSASHLSSRSQHMLSNAASPSTNRIAPSLSSSTSGSSHQYSHSSSSSSILTMEVLLASHLHATKPTEAALEALLADRNTLSQQNAQLWKFLEKQKTSYASLARDVERIRGERDTYKAKWQKLKNAGLATTSSDAASTVTQETVTTLDEAPALISSNIPVIDVPVVSGLRRSQEDPTTPRNASGFGSDSYAPSEYYTPNQTPVRIQDGDDSAIPHNVGASSSKVKSQSPSAPSPSSTRSQSLPASDNTETASSADKQPNVRTASPIPMVIPPRSDSVNALASSSRTQSSNSSIRHAQIDDTMSNTKPLKVMKTTSLDSTGGSNSHLIAHRHRPNVSMELSRESRITLPEEARQYIVNMVDSPLGSPKTSSNTSPQVGSDQSSDVVNQNSVISSQNGSIPVSKHVAHRALEGNHQGDVEDYHESRPSTSTITSAETNTTYYSQLYGTREIIVESESEYDDYSTEDVPDNNQSNFDTSSDHGYKKGRSRSGTTADQFPLPPSTYVGPGGHLTTVTNGQRPPSPRSTAQLQTLNTNVSAPVAGDSPSPSSSQSPGTATASGTHVGVAGTATSFSAPDSSTSNNAVIHKEADSSAHRSRDKERDAVEDRSSWFPIPEGSQRFRQMPLIDSDLKNTTTHVVGSHIKANEKGKEVLSFSIGVAVAGKSDWIIEKFYSDVLALDNRLKHMCSRSTLKKLAPLPDNKLFKDNAPTKVDQRKQMLQAYLQSLLHLPLKDKNDILVFFSSDMMRVNGPVTQTGYKEGYLTKRGKNFGGWKTRYFVLQGPVLEYYESRGGNHLGSIQVTGAQIGRQQKYGNDKRDLDDDNEYRHAFLIIETRKNSSGQHPRHVLCAESDEERDAWVEVLVRYVMGTYNDEPATPVTNTFNASSLTISSFNTPSPQRSLASLNNDSSRKNQNSTSSLSIETANARLGQKDLDPRRVSPSRASDTSPIDRFPSSSAFPSSDAHPSRKDPSTSNHPEDALSTSLPTSSPLDAISSGASVGLRANSELGHYPDLVDSRTGTKSPENQRRTAARASYHPSLQPIPSNLERPTTPENQNPNYPYHLDNKAKISGPMNAAPIPTNYQFGASAEGAAHSNDRERKAKSRGFWGFGRQFNEKSTVSNRPVFGVTLEDSLAVSQIASLPSIVFRCIQFLEAKHADQEEGIYRLSGSSNVIKGLKDRFDFEGDVDLLGSDEYWDPHAIAGLLKQYFRDLATPLLTTDLNQKFQKVIDIYDTEDRAREVQELISLLPIANYSLLRALVSHLILIVQNSTVNKMTVRNLGIVFSPTLAIPAPVFNLMLGDFRRVFNVAGEGSDSPDDTTSIVSQAGPNISRRNSRQYTDAAADQLLGFSGRTLPVTEEGQSDDAADELSANDESGTENATTEADFEDSLNEHRLEPSTHANRAPSPVGIRVEPAASISDSNDRTPQRSRAVAANRGLNLNISAASDRRHSRMIGLPVSPRATRPPQSPSFAPISSVQEDGASLTLRG